MRNISYGKASLSTDEISGPAAFANEETSIPKPCLGGQRKDVIGSLLAQENIFGRILTDEF